MKNAYIGIGSNMGDPPNNCLEAIKKIGELAGCEIVSLSSLFLTEPVGVSDQEWYVNGVVSIKTGMSACELLNELLRIETEMGRVRVAKWGPRLIDLDLLLYGQDVIDDATIIVPHPLMHMRKFIMAPIAEIAPELMHPVIGKTMLELFRELSEDDQVVKRLD
jgi:2-amino-4-hydroxy-6-hydroxymethyldihydropteridine diphosphokinase